MSQPYRLQAGGAIDRSTPLRFTWNGRSLAGYAGDTLASALLANGVHLVARSFKYHRPRGIMTAGIEEPNALVQIGSGSRSTPNVKATEVMLYDGLVATGVNAWPSVDFDVGALAGAFSRFMPAGFYYKTFFGSQWLWRHVYEPLIRRAAGWGRAARDPDPDTYERTYRHCDVLVAGAGPAGLMAAMTAAATGANVILADESCATASGFGGEREGAGSAPGLACWIETATRKLATMRNVTRLPRTTVFGYYDSNCLAAVQKLAEPGAASQGPRERLLHFRAGHVVLATGAHERPLVFANNDRPGIMLAGAVSRYIDEFAVLPGRRAVLFVNNDRAYRAAIALHGAGAEVAAVVDPRSNPSAAIVDAVRGKDIPVLTGRGVVDTRGTKRISGVAVVPRFAAGRTADVTWLPCDLLAVSGGYSPVVHLHSQAGGKLRYDDTLACFRPGAAAADAPWTSVGACNGTFTIRDALLEARDAASAAAGAGRLDADAATELPEFDELPSAVPVPLWRVPPAAGRRDQKHFVDLQNDTTAADLRLAVREGFDSPEHLKRYTLTGFGTDQGKTSNINALGILAEIVAEPVSNLGTTTFRPPYVPVTFATMGGRERGALFEPVRLTAIHDRHVAAGVVFEDVGQWKRPWYYPQAGEDMHAAVARECRAVRERVGCMDVSTLGKIDIQGADAAEFLNRVYTNSWLKLKIGKVRYGVICREDGMVFDDGTTARIDAHRYLMTTTTGNAAAVLEHLEKYLQTEWPELRVRLTSVTEQWATVGVAGPRSRQVLERLAPRTDFSKEAFPFLSWKNAVIGGVAVRIFRISFTGELHYEINVPWHFGASLWDAVMAAGEDFGIAPYGTETMHVLRAEKGFIIVGQETDGTQTPSDLALEWAVSERKDFIGRRSLKRADCVRPNRRELVGLLPEDRDADIPEGTQLVAAGMAGNPPPVPMEGFVTSSYASPTLGGRFCLALVQGGRKRHGEVIEAAVRSRPVRVQICDSVFYDPEGARRDGA